MNILTSISDAHGKSVKELVAFSTHFSYFSLQLFHLWGQCAGKQLILKEYHPHGMVGSPHAM